MTYSQAFDKILNWIKTSSEYQKTRTFQEELIAGGWDDRKCVIRLIEERENIPPGRFFDLFEREQLEALLRFVDYFGLGDASAEPTATVEPYGGYLPALSLSRKHNVPYRKLRGRLADFRDTSLDGWEEAKNRKRGDAQYLYIEAKVMHIINGLKAGH